MPAASVTTWPASGIQASVGTRSAVIGALVQLETVKWAVVEPQVSAGGT